MERCTTLLAHANRKRFLALLALVAVLGSTTQLFGQSPYTSVASGDWNVDATWSGTGIPVAGNVVTIAAGHVVTVTANAACTTLNFTTTNGTTTVTINSGITLAVSGTVTIPRTTSSGINTIAVGAGTLNAATIAFTDGNVFVRHQITISTGTVTVSGNVTGTGANGSPSITFTGAGLLKLGGSIFTEAQGTLTPSTGTVEYNAAGDQTVGDFDYTNLTLSGSGTKTLGGSATVNGTLSLIGGTLAAGTNLTMITTSGITRSEGSMTGTLQGTGRYNVTYTGNSKTTGIELAISGTTTEGLNDLTVNLTSGQTLTLDANRTPDGNLTVSGGIFDLSASTITRSGAGGTLTVSNGATLKIGSGNGFPLNYTVPPALGPTSTVEYAGQNQTVSNRPYGHLTLSGSDDKDMPGSTMTIAGNFTMSGTAAASAGNPLTVGGNFTLNVGTTFNAGSWTHNLAGNWSNSGVFNPEGSTFNMNGTSAQTMSGSIFNNLTINNAAGVTLLTPETVNGTLTLTNGLLDVGANNLTIASTISGGSATSYVKTSSTGLLVRQGITTTAVSFPVGIANYNPVTLRQDVDATPRNYSVLVRDPLSPPSNDDASGLKHSWVILQSSPSSIDVVLTFTWNSTAEAGGTFNAIFDLAGREPSEFDAWWHNPGGWLKRTSSIVSFSPTTMGVYPVTATVKTPILFGGSPWTIALANGALPIQLASFTATLQNNNVRLNWSTVSEVNNYGFYVEKKRLAETEWNEITNSFVAGHGTTNLPQHYSFVDNNIASGVWQYCLRQVDLDGAVHHTEPVQVDVLTDVKELAPMQFALSQNYPNPFNPSTEIKFSVETTDHAKLDVFNTLGQKVATLFDDVAQAGQYYKVRFSATGGSASGGNASSLSSGVYFYKLQSGKKSELKKLMLLK